MSDFDDSEHLPDQAALDPFRPEAKSEAASGSVLMGGGISSNSLIRNF